MVDGQDITSRLAPILISLSVTDKAGEASDKADITLDDTGGMIVLPKDGARMAVSLGWRDSGLVEVFRGKVTDVRSSFSRGEGRTLRVSANGVDAKGKAKSPKERHWDDKPLKTILNEAAKDAGVNDVKIDVELGGVTLPYVAMQGESFTAFGQRLAEMVGGTFRVSDGRAVMVKRNAGQSASGKPLTPIVAAWGVNLIKGDIAPFIGRPRFKKTRVRFYDPKQAKWREETAEVEDDGAEAEATQGGSAATSAEAKQRAGADKTSSERDKGEGSIEIDGEPRARPEAPCSVIGVRPGIDGDYKIEGVTHSLKRGGGFTTSLELKKPGGAAGKDSRKATSGGGGQSSGPRAQGRFAPGGQ